MSEKIKKDKEIEHYFPYFVLGFQDGLVNVFGVILAVAIGTFNSSVTILAGLAAAFAESISMGAVAYTSTNAEKARYEKAVKELKEMDEKELAKHIKNILTNSGIDSKNANTIAKILEKNKKATINFLIQNELKINNEIDDPKKYGFIVLFSSIIGSFVPLISFFFLSIETAIISSVILSALTLFLTGIYKSKIYKTDPIKEGLEFFFIGMTSAIIGAFIGYVFGVKW